MTALIALGIYAALAVAFCLSMHRARQAAESTPDYRPDEDVNWLPVLPPVPLPRDLQWLLDQPAEIRLTDTEVGIRLRDIEAAEGWVR